MSDRNGGANSCLTLREAADSLRVCEKTLRREIDKGDLLAFKLGRQWRLRPKAIEDYQKRRENDFRSNGGNA